jgi:hypothetical protein
MTMPIIEISSANQACDPATVAAIEAAEQDKLSKLIIMMSRIKKNRDTGEEKHIVYKLHDIPPTGDFRSNGKNYRWIPMHKSNNTYIGARESITDAIKDILEEESIKVNKVIMGESMKEVFDYMIANEWIV